MRMHEHASAEYIGVRNCFTNYQNRMNPIRVALQRIEIVVKFVNLRARICVLYMYINAYI